MTEEPPMEPPQVMIQKSAKDHSPRQVGKLWSPRHSWDPKSSENSHVPPSARRRTSRIGWWISGYSWILRWILRWKVMERRFGMILDLNPFHKLLAFFMFFFVLWCQSAEVPRGQPRCQRSIGGIRHAQLRALVDRVELCRPTWMVGTKRETTGTIELGCHWTSCDTRYGYRSLN